MTIEELDALLDKNLKEDVLNMTAKDRVTLKVNIAEFYRSKMQRTTAAPLGDADTEFKITFVKSGNSGN